MFHNLKDSDKIISIGTAVCLTIGIIFACGVWKRSIENDIEVNAQGIKDINQELRFRIEIRNQIILKMEKIQDSIDGVAQRMSRIEGKLDKR